MRGWRSKFVFLLIVYFAGFATAIYCLVPVTNDNYTKSLNSNGKGEILANFKSEQFAQSVNTGLHKCIEFSKETAGHTAEYIKQKIDEKRQQAQN